MGKYQYYATKFFKEFQFSIENMTMTHWCILGSMSLVLGFMFLRGTRG